MNVSVYLGSSPWCNKEYLELAAQVGEALAKAGHTIIYGGACVGTMNELANAALKAGGEVIGVFPVDFHGTKDVQEKGLPVVHTGLTKLYKTKDFAERKQMMEELGDCALVLPGSFGTLDELFTYACNRAIGKHEKQIYLLNYKGYYDPIKGLLINMEQSHMMKEMCRTMITFCDTIQDFLNYLLRI